MTREPLWIAALVAAILASVAVVYAVVVDDDRPGRLEVVERTVDGQAYVCFATDAGLWCEHKLPEPTQPDTPSQDAGPVGPAGPTGPAEVIIR